MITRALLFGLLLVACAPEPTLPEGVLSRAEFTAILADLQLIEARMNHELVVQPRDHVPMSAYYEEVFDQRGITREQFTLSFDHYAGDPEILKAIYEDVITELGRRKDELISAPQKP
jgi:hypothetical protein